MRRATWLLAAHAIALACVASACSETGPDAPERTNGCIDRECIVDGDVISTPRNDAGKDAESHVDGAPGGYSHPLDGTTKQATLVKGGFKFTEGPLWIGGRLLFTDIPDNLILELQPNGETTTFRSDSGGANGLAVDTEGRLIACEGGAKRVTRSAATTDATATAIATTYSDQPFNAPNDVIVRADGNLYFTDPNYSGAPNTQDDEAVYRIAPGGAISRVAHDFAKPNGIALSPNGDTLYVVDNGSGKLLSAPLNAAGEVGAFTELASTPGGDGMTVDVEGNLYVTDNNGVDVFDRQGNTLGVVTLAAQASNCTFGGGDRRTLYITANNGEGNAQTGLYSIRLNVPGLP